MSCNLINFRTINDLKSLKQILIPDYQSIQERNRDDDYDNRWNWQTSQLFDSSTDDTTEWMSTLMSSLVAISPLTDLIAFAKTRYLAVYKTKPSVDSKATEANTFGGNCLEFQLSFDTQLSTPQNSSEVITCLILVPIVSQQKSSFAFHDWTALMVGFSSGYFRVYTENGKLLLSQLLHNEPILDIKCQTFRSNSSSNDSDQILVVYKTTVVLIEGLSLYQTLRFCRNQLAKNQSTSQSTAFLMNPSNDNTLSFTFKKWKLEENKEINCCHYIGYGSRHLFDQLVAQSLKEGPYGHFRPNNASSNLLVTCGDDPFIGFYRAQEGSTAILNELTQAMVNKVKNMIPFGGFFGGNSKSTEGQTPKLEPSTSVPLHVGLFDFNRIGISMSVSPNKRMAAVVDDYGRVTLIDINKSMAIRMWKGYRDAQVGWIEVSEQPNPSPTTKRATFLVIYAPKRGILEIWVTQMGPRVGAFNVGKTCKLFECQHTLMGLNAILIQQFKDVSELERSHCFLFDYSSGVLYDIRIPFLCALTDGNSKRTRDLHLLKELQQSIQNNDKSITTEEAVQLILMFKTSDVRKEALKEICHSTDIDVIKETASQLKKQLMSGLEKNQLDFENKLIAQMCSRVLQLCQLFESINCQQIIENQYINESSNPPDIQYLIEALNWTGSDIARVLSLIAFKDAINKSDSNKINRQSVVNIAEFLSNFILFSDHIYKVEDKEVYDNIAIELNVDFSDNINQTNRFLILSQFIFNRFIQINDQNLETLLKSSAILPSNLIILVFISWLSSDFCNYWKCWQYFSQTLNILMNILRLEKSCDKNDTIDDENELLSDDWKEILEIIYDSDNVMAALIAIHMIKAINAKEKQRTEVLPKDNSPDTEWETLHIDNESLNLVIKQLEDLYLLDMLLHSRLDDNSEEFQDSNVLKISLSYILGSGPGIVSELVAKWAISFNIRPEVLNALIAEQMETDQNMEIDEISEGVEALDYKSFDFKSTSELFRHVRLCFPNCLESDVLLVNCCWELMVRWNKEPSVVDNTLNDSLEYLNYVSSAVLKHNVGCLLWKTFVLKRFECLSLLMEKMGKTPKDRICMKEMGIHENRIEAFVEYSQQLLDLILNSNMMAEMEPMPLFSVDDWWKSSVIPLTNQTVNQSIPLVILAVNQKIANGALVLEHSRLATVLELIVTFQLKSSKPLSLFTSVVVQHLFKDLNSFPVVSQNSDPGLNAKRIDFLLKSVSAIVQTLPVHNDTESDYFVNHSKHYSNANKWLGRVLSLSREWDLNSDVIRQKYVYELYFHGCDPLAQEALTPIIDVQTLGVSLLTVAGMRVLSAICAKYGSVEQLHTLPTNVMFWLKSLKCDSQCYLGASYSSTLGLLQHIQNYVYSDKTNSRICETLIETIKIIGK